MNQEANDLTVLGSIKGGAKKFNKIKDVSKLSAQDVNDSLERLENRNLITVQEKKGFLGKKIEITTTPQGEQELEIKLNEMQQKWGRMVSAYESGDKKGVKQFMDNNRSFLPMMFFFGIIDMMMFSMMFSMIGSTMTDYVPAGSVPGAGDGIDGAGDVGAGDGGFDVDIGF